jgi:diguanylate cyclase (GGDEF)-like protein
VAALHIDLTTLMLTSGLVSALGGLFLLVAWVQYRGTPAALVWGIADLVMATGVALMASAGVLPDPLTGFVGPALVLAAALLTLAAVRRFEHLPERPLLLGGSLLLLVAASAGLAAWQPAFSGLPGLFGTALYILAAAATVHGGWRRERLAARLPLLALLVLHGAMFLSAIPETLINGPLPPGPAPLTSWFGLIHFESLFFVIGSAIFLVTLIKERNEAAFATAARFDSLTGTASRRAFLERAEAILQRCRHDQRPVTTLIFDLDHFKEINDGHGHAAGDHVLQRFGATLRRNLRANDLAGRIGGEEFAVILPGAESAAGFALAERIRLAFGEECRFLDGVRMGATVSVGLAQATAADGTFEELLDRADKALYRAKRDGRNRVEMAEPPTPADAQVVRLA